MNRKRGFTMMEVLIALAVFTAAAVMLGSSYLNVLNAYAVVERAADGREDVKFAREALLAEADRDTAEKGGDFESAGGRRVQWKAKIEPANTADLFEVNFECEVSGQELKEPLRTTETFRLLRPTWSKADERDKLRAQARERIEKINAKLQ